MSIMYVSGKSVERSETIELVLWSSHASTSLPTLWIDRHGSSHELSTECVELTETIDMAAMEWHVLD